MKRYEIELSAEQRQTLIHVLRLAYGFYQMFGDPVEANAVRRLARLVARRRPRKRASFLAMATIIILPNAVFLAVWFNCWNRFALYTLGLPWFFVDLGHCAIPLLVPMLCVLWLEWLRRFGGLVRSLALMAYFRLRPQPFRW